MASGVKLRNMFKGNTLLEFKEVPYAVWGPWQNHWGYVTTVAQFDEDDIILKSITPSKHKIVHRFTDWEECQEAIELIEQDRRY
jgi:hypothetical protein